eukprot:GHVT01007358.1.p1 GENE.GHVT01007358.1~~GHVT01007358.1.p1  ORF type:complete len:146 (+),score=21.50 GHVT01007358.1:411-848(+)
MPSALAMSRGASSFVVAAMTLTRSKRSSSCFELRQRPLSKSISPNSALIFAVHRWPPTNSLSRRFEALPPSPTHTLDRLKGGRRGDPINDAPHTTPWRSSSSSNSCTSCSCTSSSTYSARSSRCCTRSCSTSSSSSSSSSNSCSR